MRIGSPSSWAGGIGVPVICMFTLHVSAQMTMPLVAIYLRELGASESEAITLSGFMNAGASLAMMVGGPIWGSFADRLSARQMILRALGGVVVAFAILTVATAPWHVVASRLIQGGFSGVTPALIMLAAQMLPPARLAAGMGVMQAAQSIPQSLAPLLGGASVALLGFQGNFALATGILLVVGGLAFWGIKDPVKSDAQRAQRIGVFEVMRRVVRLPGLRATILMTMVFQGGINASNQIMPLQIYGVSATETEAAARVGAAFTAIALGTTLGAWLVGPLSKRFSSRVLVAGAVLITGVSLVPVSWLDDAIAVWALRFLMGVAFGAAMPALRTALAEQARHDEGLSASFGSLYGFSGSAQQLGMASSSMLLALLAGFAGLTWIYAYTGVVLAVAAVAWVFSTRGPTWRRQPEGAAG
jgi:MFS family permease